MVDTNKDGNVKGDNRIVYLSGVFDKESSEKVVTSLLEFDYKDPTKDILILIDSRGGEIDAFLSLHDSIKHLVRSRVATLTFGSCMSCGSLLLMSGHPGLRFSTPNARIMIHELWGGTFGNLSEMESNVDEFRSLQERLSSLMYKYTKFKKTKSRTQLKKMLKKDTYLSPKEAIEIGLIDHIVQTPSDVFSKLNL